MSLKEQIKKRQLWSKFREWVTIYFGATRYGDYFLWYAENCSIGHQKFVPSILKVRNSVFAQGRELSTSISRLSPKSQQSLRENILNEYRGEKLFEFQKLVWAGAYLIGSPSFPQVKTGERTILSKESPVVRQISQEDILDLFDQLCSGSFG